jgi:16S rRNA (cytidine1402-2'-O)-methyltransferase
MENSDHGTLTVAASPIGNPRDASPRLALALAGADVIAAEDTRRVRRLAAALDVTPSGRLVSYYDAAEQSRVPGLLAALADGHDVLLVTDAGMPAVSDPGYRLVAAAAAAGERVTVLPGASAVTAALAVSGLPSDRFCFEGFPPRRAGERARRFAGLAAEPRTLVFFESPRRVHATLAALAEALGNGRRAVACRELTKTHEEIRRGTLGELASWAAAGMLGEVTLIVEGAPAARRHRPQETSPAQLARLLSPEQAAGEVTAREAAGEPRKQAIAAVARESGLGRRAVYDAVVQARRAAGAAAPRPGSGGSRRTGPGQPAGQEPGRR